MADVAAARAFLHAEIEALEPHDFVVTGPAGRPLQIVEVTRREDHRLEVRIPGRPPIVPELPIAVRSALRERGFASEAPADPTRPWVTEVGDADAAVDLVLRVLTEVFEAKRDSPLDVAHGSHRAEVEARRKLAALRQRVEKLLGEMIGDTPQKDPDGDYLLSVEDVHVFVSPHAVPGGEVVVRVFAVTNVGVTVSPDLGLFLARLNFGLVFGRFALDAEHHAIWVDETLLGEHFSDDEFRFTVRAVASIADDWDDRLKQMFGGATYQDVLTKRTNHVAPPTKPGHGGYL